MLQNLPLNLLCSKFPVDTRRRFNVDTTWYDVVSTLKPRRVSTGLLQIEQIIKDVPVAPPNPT